MSKNLFKRMTNDQAMAFLKVLSGEKIDGFLLMVRYQFSNDEINFLLNLHNDVKNYNGDMSAIKKIIKGAYKSHPNLRDNMVKNMNNKNDDSEKSKSDKSHHDAREKSESLHDDYSVMSEFGEELRNATGKVRFGENTVKMVSRRNSPSMFDKPNEHRKSLKYRDDDYHSPDSIRDESSLREKSEKSVGEISPSWSFSPQKTTYNPFFNSSSVTIASPNPFVNRP
jgi:hypothetical protein